MKEIIQRIEKERERMKLTKREMAIAADITPDYYSRIISGQTSPAFAIVESLAKTVGFKLVLGVI